ncbi:purine-nucleoside phosphorylase [Ihubacter sp. rT4E-8]|uniref:purine-nucleoside phosphorylase n=1 Tax=unclassified Ihubacter TaxID=2633299 RepID=UPI003C7CADA3
MSNIPTPHISAALGDFAETVLMPGDPLRSKFIAENFLQDAVLVNNVRGVQGYTGTYKGKRVSVMASGMGMPAIGIYSHELFHFYDVKNIIRVGTAGGLSEDVKVRDIVMGLACMTNTNWAAQYEINATIPAVCSYELLKKAETAAESIGVKPHIGTIFSSDVFYDSTRDYDKWRAMGVKAVEMEAAALYMEAARAGKNALCICTVSDHMVTGESCSSDDRQSSFTTMMEIALETAIL